MNKDQEFFIIKFTFLLSITGTRSLEQSENNPTISEDVFQEAPFSLRQQRALKKNTSMESNVGI